MSYSKLLQERCHFAIQKWLPVCRVGIPLKAVDRYIIKYITLDMGRHIIAALKQIQRHRYIPLYIMRAKDIQSRNQL